MNSVIQNLLSLQTLEFGEVIGENVESQVAELRGKIPQPILGHYDRLRARERKGVALVRNQVCTGCHMRVPIGQITAIMRGEDIQLCETCGRYLCMNPELEVAAPAEAPKTDETAAVKPAKKRGRKPKAAKEAALVS
jgi:predicted  nucleic acid-binding Zn-ribbon protein